MGLGHLFHFIYQMVRQNRTLSNRVSQLVFRLFFQRSIANTLRWKCTIMTNKKSSCSGKQFGVFRSICQRVLSYSQQTILLPLKGAQRAWVLLTCSIIFPFNQPVLAGEIIDHTSAIMYQTQVNELHAKYPDVPLLKIQRKLIKNNGDIKAVEEKLKCMGKFKPEEVLAQFGIDRTEFDALCVEYPTLKPQIIAKILAKHGGELKATRQKLQKKAQKKALALAGGPKHITIFVEYLKTYYPNLKEEMLKRKVERFLQRLEEKNNETQTPKEAKEAKEENEGLLKETPKFDFGEEKVAEQKEPKEKKEAKKEGKRGSSSSQSKSKSPKRQKHAQKGYKKRKEHSSSSSSSQESPKKEHHKHRGKRECKEGHSFQLNPNITSIIIDGNNLLYVRDDIRHITLKKGINEGTKALSQLFSQANSSINKDMSVVYDHGDSNCPFGNLKISIARPAFNTSDDYLVNLSQGMANDIKGKTLFVTSDRGLQDRLEANGCQNIVTSKRFLEFCDRAIKAQAK